MQGFEIRRLSQAEAQASCDRLRAIFRDAVLSAGPSRYTSEQVAVWAASADEIDRWTPWVAEGATWIAAPRAEPERAVGFALRHPIDHLHLLYVDPDFHRRGIALGLLDVADSESRNEGIASLKADASLFSYGVFLAAGYTVVAWEEAEHKGLLFTRVKMSKTLR